MQIGVSNVRAAATVSGDTVTFNGSGTLTSSDISSVGVDYYYIKTIVVEGYTKIDDYAFYSGCAGNQTELEPVVLQDVTEVGASAFDNCHSLSNISMNNVTIVKSGAFSVVNKKSDNPLTINLPNIEKIENYAFEYGKIASITIGKNDCIVAPNAFRGVGNSTQSPNPPILILPAGWTGDEPDADGNWHGGKFVYTPAPGPGPGPSPSPLTPAIKSNKKANIELTPYMMAFLNDIVNRNKAQTVVEAPQEIVDRDTFKSEAPHNTAGVTNNNSKIGDLKVHTINETTQANQKLLADSFAAQQGKRARILVSASVHPRRDLGIDAGKKETLIWSNLEKVAQPVYAVCYNETDKAYYISGILDSNDVANLNDFILRDATNVTIFVLE